MFCGFRNTPRWRAKIRENIFFEIWRPQRHFRSHRDHNPNPLDTKNFSIQRINSNNYNNLKFKNRECARSGAYKFCSSCQSTSKATVLLTAFDYAILPRFNIHLCAQRKTHSLLLQLIGALIAFQNSFCFSCWECAPRQESTCRRACPSILNQSTCMPRRLYATRK